MKTLLAVALVSWLAIGSAFPQSYDRATVVKVMKSSNLLMSQISSAANTKDFFKAAERLMELAQGMNRLLPMAPPKGDKAEWDKTIKAFLIASYRGIGAAGNQDAAGLKAALGDLQKLSQTGHALFR